MHGMQAVHRAVEPVARKVPPSLTGRLERARAHLGLPSQGPALRAELRQIALDLAVRELPAAADPPNASVESWGRRAAQHLDEARALSFRLRACCAEPGFDRRRASALFTDLCRAIARLVRMEERIDGLASVELGGSD